MNLGDKESPPPPSLPADFDDIVERVAEWESERGENWITKQLEGLRHKIVMLKPSSIVPRPASYRKQEIGRRMSLAESDTDALHPHSGPRQIRLQPLRKMVFAY